MCCSPRIIFRNCPSNPTGQKILAPPLVGERASQEGEVSLAKVTQLARVVLRLNDSMSAGNREGVQTE